MKNFLIICTCFISGNCLAQKKGHIQINVGVNAMKVNSIKAGYTTSDYIVLDSAGSLFKRFNYSLYQVMKSKIKPGISLSINYEYSIGKLLKLRAGIGFRNCLVQRDIYFQTELIDSPTVKLQGTGPTWTDPDNGHIVQSVPGNSTPSSPWGQIFGNRPGNNIMVLNRERYLFKYSAEGTEKIKMVLVELPLGFSISPGRSKFQFYAEICPSFSIHSSALMNYKTTSEILQPDQPVYTFNRTLWRTGAGISYTISQSLRAGITYNQYLNSVLKNDNVKLRLAELKFTYSIPFNINP